MRFRTLLALTVALVLGTAGAAAAQPSGTAEYIVINEVTGFGPLSVSIADATDTDAVVNLGIVGELGDARTTLPAGASYVVRVASPDALDEPLAVTEPVELVAGNRYVTIAIPQGDGIGFNNYQSDPILGGNVRVEHRTGRSETLQVNLRNGATDYDEGFALRLGAVEDRVDLPNGRYGLDVTIEGSEVGAAIDNLPVAAGQWTVVTVVADGSGLDLQVTGPGPLPGPSPSASPSTSPSPSAIRTPNRIETGAGGAAEPGAVPPAPILALGLLTATAALAAVRVRSPQKH